jgi:hypothetical protein
MHAEREIHRVQDDRKKHRGYRPGTQSNTPNGVQPIYSALKHRPLTNGGASDANLRTSKGLSREGVPSHERWRELILRKKLAEVGYCWCAFWSQGLTHVEFRSARGKRRFQKLDFTIFYAVSINASISSVPWPVHSARIWCGCPIRCGQMTKDGGGLHGSNPMSALGHKRTFGKVRLMSALPPKADISRALGDVRYVPKADYAPQQIATLLDHLIRTAKERWSDIRVGAGENSCLIRARTRAKHCNEPSLFAVW